MTWRVSDTQLRGYKCKEYTCYERSSQEGFGLWGFGELSSCGLGFPEDECREGSLSVL